MLVEFDKLGNNAPMAKLVAETSKNDIAVVVLITKGSPAVIQSWGNSVEADRTAEEFGMLVIGLMEIFIDQANKEVGDAAQSETSLDSRIRGNDKVVGNIPTVLGQAEGSGNDKAKE